MSDFGDLGGALDRHILLGLILLHCIVAIEVGFILLLLGHGRLPILEDILRDDEINIVELLRILLGKSANCEGALHPPRIEWTLVFPGRSTTSQHSLIAQLVRNIVRLRGASSAAEGRHEITRSIRHRLRLLLRCGIRND